MLKKIPSISSEFTQDSMNNNLIKVDNYVINDISKLDLSKNLI